MTWSRGEIFGQLITLVGAAGASATQTWWTPHLVGWELMLAIGNQVVSFALVALMFAMICK